MSSSSASDRRATRNETEIAPDANESTFQAKNLAVSQCFQHKIRKRTSPLISEVVSGRAPRLSQVRNRKPPNVPSPSSPVLIFLRGIE